MANDRTDAEHSMESVKSGITSTSLSDLQERKKTQNLEQEKKDVRQAFYRMWARSNSGVPQYAFK